MTRMIRTSEIAADKRVELVELITRLRYSKKKAEVFADGYIAHWRKLPLVAKMLGNDDASMSAGFVAAGIDEAQAFKRFQRLTSS